MTTMRCFVMLAATALIGCGGGGGMVPFVPNQPVADDGVGDDGVGQDGVGEDGGDGIGNVDGVGDTGDDGVGTPDGVDPVVGTCGDGTCDAANGEDSFDCPADCPVDTGPGTCANLCGAYNSQWECQCESDCKTFGDCCSDYELYCPQGTCGDGACGHDENVTSCAQDCAGPYSDVYEPCLDQHCTTKWAACQDYPGCVATWECLMTCGPDLGCVDLCEAAADEMAWTRLTEALECGKDQGCFSETGANDVVCGNGECEPGEFASTCPADCKLPGAGSCKSRCGDFTQNAPCQCDASCSKYDECCADFEALCL